MQPFLIVFFYLSLQAFGHQVGDHCSSVHLSTRLRYSCLLANSRHVLCSSLHDHNEATDTSESAFVYLSKTQCTVCIISLMMWKPPVAAWESGNEGRISVTHIDFLYPIRSKFKSISAADLPHSSSPKPCWQRYECQYWFSLSLTSPLRSKAEYILQSQHWICVPRLISWRI